MSFIIKSPDDLKDPFLCYCIFESFHTITGEDYMVYNDNIVYPYPFIFWMNGKGYITNEQLEKLLQISSEYNDAFGRRIDISNILRNDIVFPRTHGHSRISSIKCYSILSEYMSICDIFRIKLYESVNDKATIFIDNQFIKNEDGISLACIINDRDLVTKEIYTKEMIEAIINSKGRRKHDFTMREKYESVIKLTIEEADNIKEITEYDENK